MGFDFIILHQSGDEVSVSWDDLPNPAEKYQEPEIDVKSAQKYLSWNKSFKLQLKCIKHL